MHDCASKQIAQGARGLHTAQCKCGNGKQTEGMLDFGTSYPAQHVVHQLCHLVVSCIATVFVNVSPMECQNSAAVSVSVHMKAICKNCSLLLVSPRYISSQLVKTMSKLPGSACSSQASAALKVMLPM